MTQPTALVDVRRKPDARVIEQLEILLSHARAGDLIGFVAFGNHGGHWSGCVQAGDCDLGAILSGIEDWKFRALWRRNRTDEP